MIRSFLPVGQGAFYVEQFQDGTNVVYDCGSLTGVKYVEREIKSVFEQHEDIVAVFISHMHADHVNGLKTLFSHCNVKRLYLPYLTPDTIFLTGLEDIVNGGEPSDFLTRLFNGDESVVREATGRSNMEIPELIFVDPVMEIPERDYDIPHENQTHIPSGTEIEDIVYNEDDSPGWVYVPFNFENTVHSKLFLDELHRRGYIDLEKLLHDLIKEVKSSGPKGKIYKDVSAAYKKVGKLNDNSMVLYSGFANKMDQEMFRMNFCGDATCRRYICCHICRCSFPAGSLYMGDYNAKGVGEWCDLEKAFNSYWSGVGLIQVPHHGSNNNFNEKIIDLASLLIISAGTRNQYSHPHAQVLKRIIASGIPYFWITEYVGSRVQLNVEEP